MFWGEKLKFNADNDDRKGGARSAGRFVLGAMPLLFPASMVFAQTDIGSLPRVSAPGAYGDSVSTGITASSSTQRALSPPPGVGSGATDGLSIDIGVGATRHSNPDRLPEGSESDTSYVISPSIRYGGEIGRHQYELGYGAGYQRYSDTDALDSDYQQFNGALRFDLSRILIADLYAGRVEAEEQRGASGARSLAVDEEQDEYQTDTLGGRITLGRRTNTLQLYVGAETNRLEFTNNDQSFRDRDQDTVEAGLFFNIGAATALFVHARETQYDYLAGDPSIDNTETSFTGGVTWEATSAISLVLEAGRLEKEYDDSGIDGYDGSTYLGKLVWSPRERTNVSLYASRTTEESADADAQWYVSDVSGIDFTQKLGERASLTLHYAMADDEYSNGRRDDVTDYGIAFGYGLFPWMDIGISYNRIEKSSNDPDSEFVDDVYSIFVTIKPDIGG